MDNQLEETYNRIAEDWHRDHLADDWWIEGTDTFLSLLPSGARVLDVGCGSGIKSKYFLERGFYVVGIDISENLLSIAQRESPRGDFRHVSMLHLDTLGEEVFDGVFCQASLLHISKADAPKVVAEMVAHARPGGYVYIAVKETRPDRADEAFEKENDYGYEYERFFSYFTMPELEKYLIEAGAEIVYTSRGPSPSGKTVWLQIIGKRI